MDWRIRSVGSTGERNVTFNPTLPSIDREKIDLVEVYSKLVWVATADVSSGAPNQVIASPPSTLIMPEGYQHVEKQY